MKMNKKEAGRVSRPAGFGKPGCLVWVSSYSILSLAVLWFLSIRHSPVTEISFGRAVAARGTVIRSTPLLLWAVAARPS